MKFKSIYIFAFAALFAFIACDALDKYELPEAGSIKDETPPEAKFSFTQGSGLGNIWKEYSFSNQSTSAVAYLWNFGNNNTSTEVEPKFKFPGEGTYTVSLTASDASDAFNTFTTEIVVVEPAAPAVPDPILINAEFNKQAKSSGSDCACSGWINRSLGAQGESTSGNGGKNNLIKFDNDEHDAAYQEFEVVPNSDYTIKIIVGFDALKGGSFPSILEMRVLAGSGYVSGYTPTYYSIGADFPQDDFGYRSVSQMEDPANNLFVQTINHPNDKSYITYDYSFNSGANTSVAFFMRGIGGDGTPSDNKGFAYNNGDDEIQVESVEIKAK
jgi:PKD repeat protein